MVSTRSSSILVNNDNEHNSSGRRDQLIFAILTLINLLNFMDRGIVPGSTEEFGAFILSSTSSSSSVNSTPTDALLGFLQSAFIVGLITGSLLFGHLIHRWDRFTLTRLGMIIWSIAVLCAGLAGFANSYSLLFIARMFSGFGEASLQCTIPPWIERHAPDSQRGTWLAIFFTAIPVGTAFGYAYSAAISQSMGWEWAFILEVVLMAPLLTFLFFVRDDKPHQQTHFSDSHVLVPTQVEEADINDDQETRGEELAVELAMLNTHIQPTGSVIKDYGTHTATAGGSAHSALSPLHSHFKDIQHKEGAVDTTVNHDTQHHHHHVSMWEEMKLLLQRPVFLCLIFTSAAQTAVLIGLSTFGSAFMISLGFFDSETVASTMFGILVSIAGIVATPLGGYVLDKAIAMIESKQCTVSRSDCRLTEEEKSTALCMRLSIEHTYWATYCGTVILSLIFFVQSRGLYLTFITIGCGFCFFTNTGLNMAIMLSVPEENRSLGIAIGTVVGHAFGDVPSPIIAGWLKDTLAPHCVAGSDGSTQEDTIGDGGISASPACRSEGDGIRMTMLLIALWMFWGVFLTAGAWYFQLKKSRIIK